MYYYIPHLAIAFSVLAVLYVVFKKIPTVVQLPKEAERIIPQKEAFFKRSFGKTQEVLSWLKHKSWGASILVWFEKRLRQLRLGFWKVDGLIQKILNFSQEKSRTWTVRSRAWKEQKRSQKLQKLKLSEKLDKVEILEMLEEQNGEQAPEEKPVKKAELPEKTKTEIKESKKMGDLRNEKEYINRIAKNPKDREAYMSLGKLYFERGDLTDAQASFFEVLRINPEDKEAQALLKKIESQIGK